MHRVIYLIVPLALLVLAAACGNSDTPVPTATVTVPAIAATVDLIPTPTPTPQPRPTDTPVPTATTTVPAFPTITRTPIPPTSDDEPLISRALAIYIAMESFGRSYPDLENVEDAHDLVANLMLLSEYDAQYADRGEDSLVWVVEAEGAWRSAGIVPADSRETYRYASVVIYAETGVANHHSRRHDSIFSQ